MAGFRQKPLHPDPLAESFAQIEARLARVEAKLGLAGTTPAESGRRDDASNAVTSVSSSSPPADEELERFIGQPAFTLAGVIALTSGLGFLLSLPHAALPPAAPAIAGIALSAALLVAAHLLRTKAALLGATVRAAAMLLLYFATLRFFFFGRPPALELHSFSGRALLGLATVLNAALAWRARSRSLLMLALMMGATSTLLMGSGIVFQACLLLLAAAAVLASRRWNWPALMLVAIPVVHVTYFLWAIGNPIVGGSVRYVADQPSAPGVLLTIACLFAARSFVRGNREREDGLDAIAALLNCGLGYGSLLLHTAATYSEAFAGLHAIAFAVFLGVAVQFWIRDHAPIATFFYAITGYVALTMAIIKSTSSLHVFVWLSGQSLVVLATAIWFRSRLIVVANFLIYAAIVVGYVFFVKRETGVSIGFGLVALISARLLHWQQDRLELKTGLMRNAYLLSAFIVFPYALYHLVPGRCVALAWLGLAVGYYALNRIVRNQKYRWMGHATLALTALFLALASLEPAWRIASFLALGTVLLVVSLTFRNSRA